MLLPANPGCLQAGISQDLRFKVPAVSAALTQPEAHISQLLRHQDFPFAQKFKNEKCSSEPP